MSALIEGYRISPQQKRLWQLQREGLPRRSQYTLLLDGEVNPAALVEALQATAGRHESLRTSFQRTPGVSTPIQVIEDSAPVLWHALDWGALDAREQAAGLAGLFDEEESRTNDSDEAPGVSATLVALAAGRHALHLSLPALCADSRTFSNLTRELAESYEARLEGRPASGEVVQYLQFSEWQNELLEDENAAVGYAFWRGQGAWDAPTALPFERRAAARRGAQPAPSALSLEAPDAARLEEVARLNGIGVDVLLLACWQTLLWRMTGAESVTVGHVFDGRKFEELNEACGLFAKVVPVRCSFDAREPFGELAARVGRVVADAREWQEWFVWPEGDEGADAARSFAVGFAFNEWQGDVMAGGVKFSPHAERVYVERFGLSLSVVRRGDGSLAASLVFDPATFDAEDISRLASQFEVLLASVAKDPRALVGRLEVMTEEERHRLLFDFNRTGADYPRESPAHRLVEEQAARTPDAVAVIYGDRQLTYAELNARANQLAHHLKSLGVGPEVLVGVCCERTPEMVIALLATLKAGGAYLPLDLSYPPERLEYMLEDAQVPVLLTQERLVERLPAYQTIPVCLDADWDEIGEQSAENLESDAQPESPAYVIYTSGSTGRPKGVVIPHKGLVNYLSWSARAYPAAEGQGSVVHSPIGFDLTVTSLFTPLVAGRGVELVPEALGVEGLGAALERRRDLSLLKLTPAHLEVLSQLVPADLAAGSARALVIGGEALLAEHLTFWREHAPATRLFNEYGPTEAVVGCSVYEATGRDASDFGSGAVPIGRPISNARLYVLDSELNPVPAYVAGELYVGGDGLARGYLNRPDLTAEKFIPDPYSADPGARMYRTGDLARHLPSGELEYLGRADSQVKIRGFRVELGEVEAVIGSHPDVREAAATAREDSAGDRRLVAYVVAEQGSGLQPEALREYLGEKLPDYMIPSAFLMLDALPLTSNGKLDRKALPAPEGLRPQLEVVYAAPQTEDELTIATIWREALGLERVGIEDNFFDLGGHSLLLVRVSRKLQEAFGRDVPVIELFKHPTISKLVQYLAGEPGPGPALQQSQERAQTRKDAAARQSEQRERRRAQKGQREV